MQVSDGNNITIHTVAISSGGTESSEVFIVDKTLVGVVCPTLVADIDCGFLVADDKEGETFRDYYNPEGNIVKVTCKSGVHIGINGTDFSGIFRLKLKLVSAAPSALSLKLLFKGFAGA